MPSRLLRAGAVVLLGGALATACSGSDLTSDLEGASSSSSGATSSSGGRGRGSSGILPGYPGDPPSSGGASSSGTAPSDRIDAYAARAITVGKDVCGKPPGTCMDAQSFTVDFDAFTVTHTTCVEVAAPDAGAQTTDAKTTKKIDLEDIANVRAALLAVRISAEGFDGWDGAIDTLEVRSTSGESRFYSPFAGCSKEKFTKITTGWDELWRVVSTL